MMRNMKAPSTYSTTETIAMIKNIGDPLLLTPRAVGHIGQIVLWLSLLLTTREGGHDP